MDIRSPERVIVAPGLVIGLGLAVFRDFVMDETALDRNGAFDVILLEMDAFFQVFETNEIFHVPMDDFFD